MKNIEATRREIQEVDRQMADLFQKRMEAVREVAAYKKEKGLQIFDKEQEARVLERNSTHVTNPSLRQYYLRFMEDVMGVSKKYQEQLLFGECAESVFDKIEKTGEENRCDIDSFVLQAVIEKMGLTLREKKVMVLGTGEAGREACEAARILGASRVIFVGQSGDKYSPCREEDYAGHLDVEILINTTCCGISPYLEDCPVALDHFTNLIGVIDILCSPLRTTLILEARKRGILAEGGLYLRVARLVHEENPGADPLAEKERIDWVYRRVLNRKRNIVLCGMSQVGKTTVGTLLAEKMHRPLKDTDHLIIARERKEIVDIFAEGGEAFFRDIESEVVRDLAEETGLVIATGGGAVLREKNVDALKKNGIVIFLDRPLDQIVPTDDRPLANTVDKIAALFKKRYPIYRAICDVQIPNHLTAEIVTDRILRLLGVMELLGEEEQA